MGKSRATKETRQARRQAARSGQAQRPSSRRWPLRAVVVVLALVSVFGTWRYWQAERLEEAQRALEQAERERAAGRLPAADAAYRRALEARPSAAAWNGLGVVYAMQRDFEGAAQCFDEALALEPRFFEARAGLAIARQNAGDFSAAEEQYRLAIELRPSFAGTYYNLGFLYQSQGLHAAAEEQYRRALRIDSTLVQAQANLGWVLDLQHRPGEAVQVYRRALRRAPEEGPLYRRLGKSHMDLSEYGPARSAYERAVALGSDGAGVQHDLGFIRQQEGALDAAVAHYVRALEMEPGRAESHFRLGTARRALGQGAEAHFRRAVELDPDHPGAHYGLAQVVADRGERAEATRLMELFRRLKEYEGRRNNRQRAVERRPRDPQAAYELALLHLEYGRPARAVEVLERIVRLDPEFAPARERLAELRPAP